MEVLQPFRSHAVQPSGAVPALAQKACFLQHLEVLGDRRLGDREARGDLAGAQLTRGEQPQDLPACRLSDGFEDLDSVNLAGT